MKRLLRNFGTSILALAGIILIWVLANGLWNNAADLIQRINTNRLHADQQAAFPGTATAIGVLNVQLVYDKTHAPTRTPTESTDTGAADTGDNGNAVDTTTGTNTLSNTAPSPIPPTPTDAAATLPPTKVAVLATLPPTNTKRPSVTPLPATATQTLPPTVTPTVAPSETPTLPPTVPPTLPPTEAASPTVLATRPLPTLILPAARTPKQPQPTGIPSPAPLVKANNNDIINILLIGSDSDVDPSDPSFRTDSMIIVSINRTTNTVAMLSIPRDLYVYMFDLGMNRINIAFQWGQSVNWNPGGGFGFLRQVIRYNLGINVHYYARISFDGFKQIVDTLNGIDVAVDCSISDLRFQGEYDAQKTPVYSPFTLDPGFYHMNGSLALWYARMRHSSSDFDRNRRQQQVLRAIWHTARDAGMITKAPELWSQLTQIVQTDLQLQDVVGLIPVALSLKPTDIADYYMIKGYQTAHFRTPAGEDVQIPDPAGFFKTINDFYTPPTQNRIKQQQTTVEILNGTASKDYDKVAADRLVWEGISAEAKGTGDSTAKSVIYDYTGNANPSVLQTMLKALNMRPDQVVSQPDPNRTVDYRIVLGNDYKSCSQPGYSQ